MVLMVVVLVALMMVMVMMVMMVMGGGGEHRRYIAPVFWSCVGIEFSAAAFSAVVCSGVARGGCECVSAGTFCY